MNDPILKHLAISLELNRALTAKLEALERIVMCLVATHPEKERLKVAVAEIFEISTANDLANEEDEETLQKLEEFRKRLRALVDRALSRD